MPQKHADMGAIFHADESMPGWDGNHPRVGFVDSTPFTEAERAMLMHTSDYHEEDLDKHRIIGRYACPVCGSRHRLKRESLACCEGLMPGLSVGRRKGYSIHCGERGARRGK